MTKINRRTPIGAMAPRLWLRPEQLETVFSHTTGVITPGAEPQTSLPLSESLYIPLLFGGLYGGLYERLSELLSSANRFPLKFEAKRLFADFWRGQPRDVETFRRRLLYFVWRVTNETH